MKFPEQFGFYAILTNPLAGYEECTQILVDAGVTFVQLRIKGGEKSEVLRIAQKMRAITLGSVTRLIINDYPDVALESGADGVHLGQDDMSYNEARSLLGPDAIIGISTHSVSQTRSACELCPDYIGVGPVFPTPTKEKPDPVIGAAGMKRMLARATVPAVSIGGIDLLNLRLVLEAGAKNFCMVRQFTQSTQPQNVLKKIKRIYREYYPDMV